MSVKSDKFKDFGSKALAPAATLVVVGVLLQEAPGLVFPEFAMAQMFPAILALSVLVKALELVALRKPLGFELVGLVC